MSAFWYTLHPEFRIRRPRTRYRNCPTAIQDAYFDCDKHNIRPDAQAALAADAKTLGEILKQYPDYKPTVQGYCDERGSEEYLASLGVPDAQLKTISYGKEKQLCSEHDEAC